MKKNIAIIIQKLKKGGAEKAAANLSIFLSDAYNVHLIIFDGKDITYSSGGTMHDLHLPPKKSKIGKVIQFIKRVIEVKKIKKNNDIICTISLMEGANWVNILSKKNDKILVSIRNHMTTLQNVSNGNIRYSKILTKMMVNKSDKVIAVSSDIVLDCIENWRVPTTKIIEIPNFFNTSILDTKFTNQKTTRNESVSFVTMGRLTAQKGHFNLIRAFSKVIELYPDSMLYVLGDGELKQTLIDMVSDLDLTKNVIFLGFKKNPHVYIKQCDVFVLPSLVEGMSNALLEALALGMPCIATDCFSGTREILSPNTIKPRENQNDIELAEYGILTSVEGLNGIEKYSRDEVIDIQLSKGEVQLKDAMLLLLENQSVRENYAVKSANRIKDFLPHVVVKQWIDVIDKM